MSMSSRARASELASVPRAARAGAVLLVAVLAACGVRWRPTRAPTDVRIPSVPLPAAGLGTVVGTLADSATGDPVWGAVVFFTHDSVIGSGRAARRIDLPADTSERDGSFTLRDVPAGRYTLATDDLDYLPMRRVVIVRPDQIDTVMFRPRHVVTR